MYKRIIQNIAIALLFLMALKDIWASLPFRYIDFDKALIHRHLSLSLLQAHHVSNFLAGLIMLMLSYNLYKRIRIAWGLEVLVLSISMAIQMLHMHQFTLPLVLTDLFILAVLLASYNDFSRPSDRGSLRSGIIYFLIALGIIFVNTAIGIFILKEKIYAIKSISDAFIETFKLFVFMDSGMFTYKSAIGRLYLDTSLIVYWAAIFIGFIALMKPLLYEPILSKFNKSKARTLVMAHGHNPLAYLALEDDKLYFFSETVQGLCVYKVVGNVMIICGDIICAKADAFIVLSELMAFARRSHYDLFLMDTTEAFKEIYLAAGFGLSKSGEAACFDLSTYSLSGGQGAKMRAAINHATKAGIQVREVFPGQSEYDDQVKQMRSISREWLDNKSSPELQFTLGRNHFSDPLDRRYFVAEDEQGTVWGYIVFNPYLSGKAYMSEVTRRRNDAPRGIMEKINYEAFMQFKSEGAIEATLGLSPLYNVASEGKGSLDEKLFAYIYEHMNDFYDFGGLHRAKSKYSPTHWEPRYYAYLPKPFMPQYAYAIVKAQMPHKMTELIVMALKQMRNRGGKSETSTE